VTDTSNNLLLRIDPARPTVDRIAVGNGPTGVAVGRGQVWVVNQLDRTVPEVNPCAHRQVATIPVGNGAVAIAYGFGSVWVANTTDDTISRINATTSEPAATVPLVGTPDSIAVGPQGIWVTSFSTGQLLLVDPFSNQVSRRFRSETARGVSRLAPAASGWRTLRTGPSRGSTRAATVSHSKSPSAAHRLGSHLGTAPSGWRTASTDPSRASTRRETRSQGSSAWATSRRPSQRTASSSGQRCSRPPASHRGGTLRVVRAAAGGCRCDSVDPAVFIGVGQWQMLSLTNDGLVTYRRVGGLAGNTLVPDLATALPIPTDGGRTYTFHLRSGIH
jgi:hypothetical protein